jgi:hypothetical protein
MRESPADILRDRSGDGSSVIAERDGSILLRSGEKEVANVRHKHVC